MPYLKLLEVLLLDVANCKIMIFLRTFIVPFHTKLLDYYRDTLSHCHPRLLHTVQLPLHLGSDGPDWSPLEPLVLSIPCLATDPAVIEDIRLVNAAQIRLGGPKRQKWFFFKGKTRNHRTAPRKMWCPQLGIFT